MKELQQANMKAYAPSWFMSGFSKFFFFNEGC